MWERYIDSDGTELHVEIFNKSSLDRDFYLDRSHNILHRLDGPARQYNNGSYIWFKNGKTHRLGGPALFYHKYYEWRINGKLVNTYYICG